MSSQKKKLTRKRLNNALAEVYHNHPSFFLSPPTKMSFFQHIHAGHLDDVKEFLEEPDFNINMRDADGNGCLFFAMDGLGGLSMVKLLLENGADINMMNYIGEVPLHVLCRNLTAISLSQLEILQYMMHQENLLLISYFGQSLEEVFLHAIDDIESFHQWVTDLRSFNDTITPEEEARERREFPLLAPLSALYDVLIELSEEHVQYIILVPANSKERIYHYIDTRMTGAQLKQYIQRQIYKNPSMNIDLLFRGKIVDLSQSLASQGIVNDATITYQVHLASGTISRRGGKRKTRKRT